MKKCILLYGILFFAFVSHAQTGVSAIQKYGGYLKTWMDEDNIEMREKITQMCEGKKSSRVDDQLLKEFMRLSKKSLADGDKIMTLILMVSKVLMGKQRLH